jgi:hypothetical protein
MASSVARLKPLSFCQPIRLASVSTDDIDPDSSFFVHPEFFKNWFESPPDNFRRPAERSAFELSNQFLGYRNLDRLIVRAMGVMKDYRLACYSFVKQHLDCFYNVVIKPAVAIEEFYKHRIFGVDGSVVQITRRLPPGT